MISTGFFKPTTLKLLLALVLFFLLSSGLNFLVDRLCVRLPGFSTPCFEAPCPHRLPTPMGYYCYYFISYSLLIFLKSNIIVRYFVLTACLIVSYFLSCLILLIAHKLKKQK